ncbi:hypothetical protein [Rhizobium laguerreae]|uniref:hypothetical protein n=1 Tax=Rhizobium laguerreae TaxID=1076926 RepID=UPI001C90FD6D|nr:hypothetical protein [Rhizobium laguerreae]MBY3038953.1 hypothetical protein [Rhizobium laguerreae]
MEKPPLSMLAQSELIDCIVGRCVMRGGDAAGETILVINRQDVDDLVHLANRLRRLSLFEDRIRKMVMNER